MVAYIDIFLTIIGILLAVIIIFFVVLAVWEISKQHKNNDRQF